MRIKCAIKNLFAKKHWVIQSSLNRDVPGVKQGTVECTGNFFAMVIAMLKVETHYPKI